MQGEVKERRYSRRTEDGGLEVNLDGAATGLFGVTLWPNDGDILASPDNGSDAWEGDVSVGAFVDDADGGDPFIQLGVLGPLDGEVGYLDAHIALDRDGARKLADDLIAAAALLP